MDFTVNAWALLVATVGTFGLGALGTMALSKPWMAATTCSR